VTHDRGARHGIAAALAAAALFGVTTPLAKPLVAATGPLMLAALLYLGAGAGLALASLRRARDATPPEAALRRGDAPLLVAIVAAGGIAAPVLMLLGLARVSAVVASLLLNLEAPLTMLLAVALFGEHLGGRAAAGAALVAGGAAVLAWAPGALGARWPGVVALVLACAGWALDNNLTQRLSLRDPVAIARTKGLAAGGVLLAVALALGRELPSARTVLAALVLGAVGYGVSVALAVRAMRQLGAAREAAYFATAPFVGAVAAVPLLGTPLGLRELAAGGTMALGIALLLAEVHAHWHVHERLEHDHAHVHDAHHRHTHRPGEVASGPHAHPHVHVALSHAHPHAPDVHHRHRH
jgi:drug/metabolite transporter (DMT)-like permease